MAETKITDLSAAVSVDRSTNYLEIAQAGSSNKITPNQILGITGDPVGTSDSQTLTSKTLTSPTVSSPTLSGTIAGTYTIGGTPTFPSSVVTLTGTQTLTNKTLTSPTINTATISNPTITTDAISEHTSANGITIDGLNIKDSKLNTNNSVVTANITDGAVTNAKLSTTAGEIGAAWQSWTPTWTGVTVSSSTVTAKYIQIGKTVIFRLSLVFGGGNGATLSNPRFSLPVTATTYGDLTPFGFVGLEDTGTATTFGTVRFNVTNPTTTAQIVANTANTIYVGTAGISSTAPHTWANTDIITATGTYEAA